MIKLKTVALAAISGLMASGACAQAPVAQTENMKVEVTEHQIDEIGGVIYSQIQSRRSNRAMRMTLLVPRTAEKKPAIIYFPGGGFTTTDYEKFIEMRFALAKAGFVVAAAEYRVVPNKFPAILEDGKSAVRFLKAHADAYGIDASKIGVLGDSAGGYLSQMVAVTGNEKQFDKGDNLHVDSTVQAAATLYGISDLRNIGAGFDEAIQKVHQSPAVTEALLVNGVAFNEYPGASILSDSDKALAASSFGHIKKNLPPFLIMHGTEDKLVSPVQSEQLYEALKQNGNRVTYVKVEGAAHGDTVWFQKPIIDKVVTWFKDNLK
ncbi:alpha/beta hydrolase [Parasutterella secunda]|uniref:alpha/beta hydrolase n=1 Tax=Parasutterella secunda TaxID=626947 RepID=UPI0025A4BBFC|nr:alpha/beta hydrolase [Parasutterella secunda]MDM8113135.1 alpha/beta hydrolase [Parasutterella secunda]